MDSIKKKTRNLKNFIAFLKVLNQKEEAFKNSHLRERSKDVDHIIQKITRSCSEIFLSFTEFNITDENLAEYKFALGEYNLMLEEIENVLHAQSRKEQDLNDLRFIRQ
jgi:hypothetical protein